MAIKEFNETKGWSISWMCKTLDVTRSAYYKWINRKETKQEKADKELAELIKECYEENNGVFGYRMITDIINEDNKTDYKEKKVLRIMRLLGLQSITRRKKKRYRKTDPEITAENILARDFNANKPNEKWVTDVTEFKASNGKKVYLSAILDLYDRTVVAFEVSHRNDNDLVFKTFDKAIINNTTKNLIFHSDRGFQYTSPSFKFKLDTASIVQSMSRPGKCIDNAPIEGFWGIMKCEMFYLREFTNTEEIIQAINKYILFYNYRRPQRRFDKQTPMTVRLEALKSKTLITQYPIALNNRIINFHKMINQKQLNYAII